VLTAEIGEFPPQVCGILGLLPQHRFRFEQARPELRIVADEVVDRLGQEGEVLLGAAVLLQPVDRVGEADQDQLVLPADGIEGAVRADHERIGLALVLRGGRSCRCYWEAGAAAPSCSRRASGISSCYVLLPKPFLNGVQPEDRVPLLTPNADNATIFNPEEVGLKTEFRDASPA